MASTIKVDNVQNQPGTNIVNKCGTTVTVGAASDNIRSAGNNLQAADGGNLISQCGTAITLGASGDSINLAAGASQTGFGRTGTVDWVTTPKVTGDSPVTGVSGNGYFLNTTAGTITINLPAGSAGDIVSMADYAATWQTNNVTVAPNGTDKIGALNESATLSTEGQSVTFVYVDSTQGWVNTMDSTSNVRGAVPFMSASVSGACNTLTTVCTNYKMAKFVGPGTFTVCAVASCTTLNAVAYMVVAGGGGAGPLGGGGGGGGFREGTTTPIVPYTASPLVAATGITVTATPYPITVGAGGTANLGTPGATSTFSTIDSAGGGSPPSNGGQVPSGPLSTGGSGAGGTHRTNGAAALGNTPPVSPAQGFPGATPGGTNHYSGCGGGGATEMGVTGAGSTTGSVGGRGGAGTNTQISGGPTAYSGGGGGSGYSATAGGAASPCGTGGAGAQYSGCLTGGSGTINSGGAGAGGHLGGVGGSGVVIIRYKFQ